VYTNIVVLAYDPSVIWSLLPSHWRTTQLWMYTNTAALANDLPMLRLSKPSCGHINRLCSGHQHRRLVLRPDCQRCGFTVASTAETPVHRLTPPSFQLMIRQYKGHGHHHLAPRSAFDDRLVSVGLLKDSVVTYF
jgi:transposase-like protein